MTRLPTTHASSRPVSYRRQASEYCAAAPIGPNQPKNKTSLALPRSGPSRTLEPAPQEASARGGAPPQPGAVLSNLNPTTPATATPSPGRGDSGYAGGTPPTQLRLNRSDPDVLTPLLTATDSMVSCFSSRGATQQSVERQTREDYRERSQPAQGEVASKRRHSRRNTFREHRFPIQSPTRQSKTGLPGR
jgi:hypothetical protein